VHLHCLASPFLEYHDFISDRVTLLKWCLEFCYSSQVKALAPEFYDHLPYHTSWSKVYMDYIFRTDVNPFNRVKREPVGSKKAN